MSINHNQYAVGHARLLELADLLQTLPPKSLNMLSWMSRVDERGHAEYSVSTNDLKKAHASNIVSEIVDDSTKITGDATPAQMKECGFAACAVGWAGSYKPFINEGFHMAMDKIDRGYWSIYPQYIHHTGTNAVCAFFALSDDYREVSEWQYLFGPGAYKTSTPTPADVANRIRKFVERRKAGKPGVSHQWITAHPHVHG